MSWHIQCKKKSLSPILKGSIGFCLCQDLEIIMEFNVLSNKQKISVVLTLFFVWYLYR